MAQMFNWWLACPEYCERYAKAEDIGSRPDEDSSDGDVSEEEYMSSDEEMAGHADPWTSSLVWIGRYSLYYAYDVGLVQGDMLYLFDSQIEYQRFAGVKAYKYSVLMHR